MDNKILGVWFPVNTSHADTQQYIKRERFKIQCMMLGIDARNAQDLIDLLSDKAKITAYTFDELAEQMRLYLASGMSLVKAIDKLYMSFPT